MGIIVNVTQPHIQKIIIKWYEKIERKEWFGSDEQLSYYAKDYCIFPEFYEEATNAELEYRSRQAYLNELEELIKQ